jgi:hypothetical protein
VIHHQPFRGMPRRLISLSFILVALLLPVLQAGPAQAAGRLVLSASEGKIGDTVVLSGSGFVAGIGVRAYFSSNPAAVGNEIDNAVTSYQIIGDAVADSAAAFAQLPFAIPARLVNGKVQTNVGPGDYYIYVTLAGSKRIQAAAGFFVLGPVSTNPTKGRIGDYVNINGTGLKPSDLVYIYFSPNRVLPGAIIGQHVTTYQNVELATVSREGTLGGGVSFQIPLRLTDGKAPQDVHGGDYYFYTADFVTRTVVQTMTRFTVLDGEMTVTPEAGNVGAEVTISGQGLRPNQEITVTYDDEVITVKTGNTATTDAGKFTSTLVVPQGTGGSHRITVSDVTGNHPETWFTVKPAIYLVKSAALGDRVEVSGTGFGEAQEIAINVAGQAMSTEPAIITSNRIGSFSGTFRVPPPAGATVVQVIDKSGHKAEAALDRSTVPAAGPAMVLAPGTSPGSPGHVGQQLTVSGARFLPGVTVTVNYGKEAVKVGSAKTDAAGAFEVVFAVPGGTSGDNPVSVTDGTNTTTATFVLESTAPAPPLPLLPEVVSGVKPATRFDWADLTDPSGVSYTFEVSAESSFTAAVLRKEGLSQSEYTLPETERLQLKGRQSTYYWRVRAVDGAGNASIWSVPILFFVGSAQSALPPWITYALITLGVLAIIIVGTWLAKVRANRRIS